jgi:hypothetical protein
MSDRVDQVLSPDPSPEGKGEPAHAGRAARRNVAIVALLALVLAGLLWWFDPAELHLPLCAFHRLTGLDCPGCGATRATHELLHGRIQAAWRSNALWVLLLPAFIYAAAGELWMLSGGRPWPGSPARQKWFWAFVVVAAAIFFILRNLLIWM